LRLAYENFVHATGIETRGVAQSRFARHGTRLHALLHSLYGARADFDAWFIDLCGELGACLYRRTPDLRALDAARERKPDWFLDARLIGYCAYVDRFGGTLSGVVERVDYLRELGVGYLHLLPFLRAREGDSDGGFAVADFGAVEPVLGDMDDLQSLAIRLRQAGISLCADMVLNHVADTHAWAQGARAGDPALRAYFHVYPDRELPDRYEQTVAEVFPQNAPGNFTWVEAMSGWVWTTFYPYQWDLNYGHPPVFAAIATALLELANRGVEIFRLDSAPFLWKRLGSSCTNQPEVHTLLSALRAVTALVTPAVLLQAEAVMPSAQVVRYFGACEDVGQECHLAYHSGLMAAAWVGLAEGNAQLVHGQIADTPAMPAQAGWVSYVRCHDDIVWAVLRPDVEQLGGNFHTRIGHAAAFLEGRVAGSYAHGAAFQSADEDAVHGTNGMAASLVGLIEGNGVDTNALARRRLALLYGLAFFVGAIPLIYMGDELGQPNSHDPRDRELLALDGRWLQRPRFDTARLAGRADNGTPAGMAWSLLRQLAQARGQACFDPHAPVLALPCDDARLLLLGRGDRLRAAFNFSGERIELERTQLASGDGWQTLCGSDATWPAHGPLVLQPWSMLWIGRA